VAAVLVTLDTSCVIAASTNESTSAPAEVEALDAILDLARIGTVALQLTASYDRDFDRLRDPSAVRSRLEWLASAPVLPTRAPGAFRLDVSQLNGPDVLVTSAIADLSRQLRSLLAPQRARTLPSFEASPGTTARIMSDVDHLVAHAMSGAAWFATLDKGILGKHDALARLGLHVAPPSELLPTLHSQLGLDSRL
jgi:hypothetical protein